MGAVWLALANAGLRVRPRIVDFRFLWATLAFITAVVVGYLVIVWADRWRKRPVQYQLSASAELARYQLLYERGELSQEEFDQIRALLSQRLRQEMKVPAVSPPAAPEQGPRPSNSTEAEDPRPG